MPNSYVQLLIVNMLLATLISTTVLGAPILPSVAGALGAGALLYTRHRARTRHAAASTTHTAAVAPLWDKPNADAVTASKRTHGANLRT